jgi:hypothetical protein
MFSLQPPRHIPTLPQAEITALQHLCPLRVSQQTLRKRSRRRIPHLVDLTAYTLPEMGAA